MSWNKFVDGVAPTKEYLFKINGKTFRGYHDGYCWNLYGKDKFCLGSDALIMGRLKNKMSLLTWIRCEDGCNTGDILITDLDGNKQRNFR
jgi:hypothetical protein